MLSFFSKISWTYYFILGLFVLLLLTATILKSKIEEVGSLNAQNSALSQQLAASERDKANLDATLQATSKASLEDVVERDKLRSSVAVLNKQIISLKRLTKDKTTTGSSDVKFNNQSSDDLYLSSELTSLLNTAYCSSKAGVCSDPKHPSK